VWLGNFQFAVSMLAVRSLALYGQDPQGDAQAAVQLANVTPAIDGTQTPSPAIELEGRGFGGGFSGTSKKVRAQALLVPIEGDSGTPRAQLVFQQAVGSDAFAKLLKIIQGQFGQTFLTPGDNSEVVVATDDSLSTPRFRVSATQIQFQIGSNTFALFDDGTMAIDFDVCQFIGVQYQTRDVGDEDYTILSGDYLIQFNGRTAPRNAVLPVSPNPGQVFVVADGIGLAPTYPITVLGNGKMIAGQPTDLISAAYGTRTYIAGSTGNWSKL